VGWYLQQFLKMGAARHVAGLSDHYLLWDSDMVPLKPMQWFVAGHANRSRAVFNTGGCVCVCCVVWLSTRVCLQCPLLLYAIVVIRSAPGIHLSSSVYLTPK